MHPFRQYIQKYTSLSDQEWKKVKAVLRFQHIPAGHVLLEEGKICRSLYFLEEGLLRFYLWRDGKDITKFFI